ncbi:MAG: type II toxin-antitoxin system PemK/MazF family toxin [Candidatus Desantisbacteria bacterium]
MIEPALPHRGEVWLVDFNPGRGHEQSGVRPALVIQSNLINQTGFGTTVILAISKLNEVKRRGVLNVCIKKGEGGLAVDSVIKCHQIYTIDTGRLIKRFGILTDSRMKEVEEAVKIVFGFIKF